MTKPRRRTWTLSPRDLPDPRLLKDESARLGDLENNPAFRMLVYRQSKVPFAFAHPYFIGMIYILIFFVSVSLMGGIAFFVTPISLSIIQIIIKAVQGKGKVFLLGITREHLGDLVAGGQSPRQITLALWGYHLRMPLGWNTHRMLPIIAVAVALILAVVWDSSVGYFLLPLAFWGGLAHVHNKGQPYFALKQARATLDRCMDVGRTGGISIFSGCTPAILMMIFWAMASVVWLLTYHAFHERGPEAVNSTDAKFLTLGLVLGFAFAGAMAGIITNLYASHAENIEKHLWHMDKQILGIMALATDADSDPDERKS